MEQHDLPALADVVLRVADVCEELAVPYAIGGAVAASFWGVPRTTQDADFLIAVPAVAYQRLADALNARSFHVEQPSGPQPVTVVALLEQVRRDRFMTRSCRATSVEHGEPDHDPTAELSGRLSALQRHAELRGDHRRSRALDARAPRHRQPRLCQARHPPPKSAGTAPSPRRGSRDWSVVIQHPHRRVQPRLEFAP
jgi:hypothetical protein